MGYHSWLRDLPTADELASPDAWRKYLALTAKLVGFVFGCAVLAVVFVCLVIAALREWLVS